MGKSNVRIQNAIDFAAIAHAGQMRLNGEPFINHVIRVKKLLEEIGIEEDNTLIAAILHASISTGNVTLEEITKEFGEDVSEIVYNLSIIANITIPKFSEDDLRVHNLHKLFIQLSKDVRVLMIRLADRVDSIKHSECLPIEDQLEHAENARILYAPIAKAIGIYTFTRELENEALRIENKERHLSIQKYLKTQLKHGESILNDVKSDLSTYMDSLGIKYDITIRTKGIYSIHSKTIFYHSIGLAKNIDDFKSIPDILGIRILVDNVEQCYQTLAYIQSKWDSVKGEFDDYISNPKPNGYRSLQITLKLPNDFFCEVQIRTFEMHEYDEYGPASHYSYKYMPSGRKVNTAWIKDLIDSKKLVNEGGKSKVTLFEDTVFVFTPKNDLVTLPAHSTPIDFAYSVHSDIGNHCIGAKVNGKRVSLKYELKSGEIVEIETARNQKPSWDWLKIVKTKIAKEQIRKGLDL